MSDAVLKNVTPVAVLHEELAFYPKGAYEVPVGPALYVPQYYTSTSYPLTGQGNITWTILPPGNERFALSRKLYVRTFVELTINVTTPSLFSGLAADFGLFDAPRAFPFSQTIDSTTLTLNTTSWSLLTYLHINAFLRCNMMNEALSMDLSCAPSALDQYQNYDDAYASGASLTPKTLIGVVSDPLQSLGQSVSKYSPNRGGFPITVVSNNGTTAVVRVETVEPLWITPLDADPQGYALIGINQLQFSIMNTQPACRYWSHNNDNTQSSKIANPLTQISMSFFQAPQLLVTWFKPPATIAIPPVSLYNNSVLTLSQTIQPNIPPRGTWSMATQSQNINVIPNRILLYCSQLPSDRTCNTSDTFAQLLTFSIELDSEVLLTMAQPQQLWRMSVDNGCNISWPAWSQTVGSVFIIDMGRNVSFSSPAEAGGTMKQKLYKFNTTWLNLNYNKTINFQLNVVYINNGLLTITESMAISQNGVLQESDVIRAAQQPGKRPWKESRNYYGSGFKLTSQMPGANGYSGSGAPALPPPPAAKRSRHEYEPNPVFSGGASITKEELGQRALEYAGAGSRHNIREVDDDDEI